MTESEIQKAVFEHLRTRGAPKAVFWHVPNDKSSRRKAGYRAGVHDVHVVHGGKFFSLELKTDKGQVQVEQLSFRDRIHDAGGYSHIAYGLSEALTWLEACGVIRKEAA